MNTTTYKIILSEEIRKEVDTDYGILRAYWASLKRLIELREGSEARKLAGAFGRAFGDFKKTEALGDIIDAGL